MAIEPYERERVEKLNSADAFRYCSGEELRTLLDPAPDWRVADLGSGTGTLTSELAPVADRVFAVDVRRGLHENYRDRGLPANVTPVQADFETLPFPDDSLDGCVSMRTYHHGFQPALDEIARVLRPGGRIVIVDWSTMGAGERDGRTDEEYFDLATVQSDLLAADFAIAHAQERYDTFVVVGKRT